MVRKVTIGLVQMAMTNNPDSNLSKAIKMIENAAKKGAQIICLPELFRSPYFPQEKRIATEYAEEINGQTANALSAAAKDNNVVIIGGSIFEKAGKRFYNTSMVFDADGRMLGLYRKVHLPQDECFYEKTHFSPGDLGFKVFETRYGKVGTLICYDQWYPEAARINVLMGAEMIFYPTAIGVVKGIEQKEGNWHEAWETVMRGHAIANGVIVAAANRVGTESNITFWGKSFVCDAFGRILARADDKERIVIATCDLDHGKEVREGWGFFYNRRPETYKMLVEKR
jgi:agmatine deiminase